MDDRRKDETQKEERYMEVMIEKIMYNNQGEVDAITYSYAASPEKKDTYEVRNRKAQDMCIDLRGIEERKCYEVHVVNVGSAKRTSWVWMGARLTTKQHAITLFKIRQRKAPSRNVAIADSVVRASYHFGILADDAYAIWKHNNNGQEPSYLELLWQITKMKDKVDAESRKKAVEMMKDLRDALDRHLAMKGLIEFGDGNPKE